ncbi:MAG: cell wall metabolism sensor histidine kinase WalK, partial [Thermoflexibacter sp.]|nr:cell wall metabolism sensor histidine kinase WalK [Thermoflexibacter sp.]
MKKQRKHILSLVLMGSSLLFLLTFQYFWLKQVYEDEKQNFFKETNLLFFDVMSALQDSLIQKNIKSASVNDSVNDFKYFSINDLTNELPPPILLKQDSSNAPKSKQALRIQSQTFTESKVSIALSSDSKSHSKKNIKLVLPKNKSLDTTKYKISSNAEIQVFIASNKPQDSINQILESVIKNRSQLPQQTKSFVIRLDGDTISDRGVRQYFQQAIDKANIPLNFELKKTYDRIHARQGFLFGREIAQPETGMLTAPFFCIPPSPVYQVYFPEYQSLIFFRKMLYPFILSFALFVLTAGAFFLIYNNLQKQEKLILLKNDFISNVTHELKTPVTTVGVAIEALQNFNALQNPSLTKEYLEISQNELNRLSMLIDKIMKMSSFESKGIELKLTNIDIQQLINQILKSMKLQFDKYGAKVEFFG